MKVDVTLTPGSFSPDRGKGCVVVVVDVLRASTTVIAALNNGAERVIPVRSKEEAIEVSKRFTPGSVLLCGERKGIRIKGFDLGNSPTTYDKATVRNRVLIFTSTNGSGMILKAREAEELLIAGFINAGAVVERVIKKGADVVVACSGKEGDFSLEDSVCAGMIVRMMSRKTVLEASDSARAASILFDCFEGDLLGMVQGSSHGKYLIEIGMADDLATCVSVDVTKVVPVLTNEGLVKEGGLCHVS